jgi:Family of unknown function (DUF6196)
MVSVSHESPEQTARRLAEVLRRADLRVHAGVWGFVEAPRAKWTGPRPDAVAVVFDDEVASELAPTAGGERFGVFSFHFADEPENSGFVGWLASELKSRLGTGAFVVCGYNGARGGVFDYWGVPHDLLDDALAAIAELRR